MPPKVKITKQDILTAAVELVRAEGAGALNARTLATVLGCSTQPLFSNFESMEALRLAVAKRATDLCDATIRREVESGQYPVYKASGMAYIRFAKEERELFKLLYMCDRSGEVIPAEEELTVRMENTVQQNTGLGEAEAKLFHLEMWAYVHGIAVMFATGFLNLEWELVSRMLTDSYRGLCKQYGME